MTAAVMQKVLFILVVATAIAELNGFASIPTSRLSRRQPVSPIEQSIANRNENGGLSAMRQRSPNLSVVGSIEKICGTVFATGGTVPIHYAFLANGILFAAASSKLANMLTPSGIFHAMALGTGLWSALGWKGWLYCVLYLGFGNIVTKVKFAEKEARGLAEGRGGRRGAENVWGSAATGLLCAVCSSRGSAFLGISSRLYVLGYVASIATKLADTFASEIGKAYGKTTFLITTFARVDPGTEGAVSLEGTAAAALGGLILSLCGLALGLIDGPKAVIVSTIAAFLATNAESVLGAVLQGKPGLGWITNEVVNFFNTVIGAGIAMTAGKYILGM